MLTKVTEPKTPMATLSGPIHPGHAFAETAAYVQENARMMRYRGGATVVALVMEARSFVP